LFWPIIHPSGKKEKPDSFCPAFKDVKKAFLTSLKRRIFCETVSSQKTSLRSPSPCTARV
ncbi:MAG TPA: hypothetical protein PKN39_05625, partial [Oscillospiraceae bacterium]|nr:hypothetical protein [Oscillospiraceae bacterium]